MKKYMLVLALACGTFSTSFALGEKRVERGPAFLTGASSKTTTATINQSIQGDTAGNLMRAVHYNSLLLTEVVAALTETQTALGIEEDLPESEKSLRKFSDSLGISQRHALAAPKNKSSRRRRRA